MNNITEVTKFLSTPNRTVSIVGSLITNEKSKKADFIDGKGYVDENNRVWIYCLNGEPKNSSAYPYFWIDETETKIFSEPPLNVLDQFNGDNIVNADLASIVQQTKDNEELFDEEEINDINASSAIYMPQIKNDDDFLKKIVKNTIIKKGININRLKTKTGEKYVLSNMKTALSGNTKMSVLYFIKWMEIMDCSFEVVVQDKDTKVIDALGTPIAYMSDTDNVYNIVDGNYENLITGFKYTDDKSEHQVINDEKYDIDTEE